MDDTLKKLLDNGQAEQKDYLVTLDDVAERIDDLHLNGLQKGYDLGFDSLHDYYTILPGRTTYIVGSPAHGKTYFWFECLINLSDFYGLKHLIFSPEMGDAHEIYADLCSMVIGKKFQALDKNELKIAKEFVNEYFKIIAPSGEGLTVEGWFWHAEKYKPDTLTGDPFNEFLHDFRDDYNRQDLYIERQLSYVRRKSKDANIHTCIINHARDQKAKEENGIIYYPPPTAREYAGGQAWFRKGQGMICLWRPPEGVNDPLGEKYPSNEVHIIVQKAKPRGMGKTGTVKLYLDQEKWRYYEMDSLNTFKKYAHKLEKAPF